MAAEYNAMSNELAPAERGKWSSDVCDCCSHTSTCCMGFCCPCVLYGQVSQRIGSNGMCDDMSCGASCCVYTVCAVVGFAGCGTCFLRQKVRKVLGIEGGAVGDFCCSCFCTTCVLCQMANHLKIQEKGIDFGSPPRLETMQR
ncbi:hypothetical protein PINS_up017201 [Pythium insidiosum]|nr:hypothetical protein PINS_up017201 [Pythium insidiosum]